MLKRTSLQTSTTRDIYATVFTEKDVNLVHQQDFFFRVRLETGACDQTTKTPADVALDLQIILAELPNRAVDDAFRDAKGLEEVLEEVVIPVAHIDRIDCQRDAFSGRPGKEKEGSHCRRARQKRQDRTQTRRTAQARKQRSKEPGRPEHTPAEPINSL